MKNKQRGTVIVSALFAALCLAQTASAFYAPSLQRWVTRDPLGESGFERLAKVRVSGDQPSAPHIGESRRPPNLFLFVENNPAGKVDSHGLKGWFSVLFPPRVGGNSLHCALVSRTSPVRDDPNPGKGNRQGQEVCIWRCNRWGDEVPTRPPTTEITFAKPGQPCSPPKDPCGGKTYNDPKVPPLEWLTPPEYE